MCCLLGTRETLRFPYRKPISETDDDTPSGVVHLKRTVYEKKKKHSRKSVVVVNLAAVTGGYTVVGFAKTIAETHRIKTNSNAIILTAHRIYFIDGPRFPVGEFRRFSE